MNPKRRAPIQASVALALGLAAFLVAWFSGARPYVIVTSAALAIFIAYAIMNIPRPTRRHGSGQVQEAVNNRLGHFGSQYPEEPAPPEQRAKVGRNEPCPCGSGLKFKQCCGA